MNDGPDYGATRDRAASVSYADIEAAARRLMANGGYPSVAAVRKALKRGSTTTIAEAMRRFWKDQAALTHNPNALTRLPPDFATAAADLWEQALTLAQQTAKHDDNAARERLKELAAEHEVRAQALTLREKGWETAARERERALADARDHLLSLSKALAREQATNHAQERRITDLETEVAQYRQQIGALIAGAIAEKRPAQRRRPPKSVKPAIPRASTYPRKKKPVPPKPSARRKTAATARHCRRQPNNAKHKSSRRKPRHYVR